jgi:long-chain acyl-CoA synthetase
MSATKPWLKYYEQGVPEKIPYPDVTLYQRLMQSVQKYPNVIAYDFMGTMGTYQKLGEEIDHFAQALVDIGVKAGDVVTISMPTAPNGIVPIYALNKIGAVASMIHPLSPAPQIKMYLNISKSKYAITLDAFYGEFKKILHETSVQKLILGSISDCLSGIMKPLFWLAKGRKIAKVPPDPQVLWYKDLMAKNYSHKVDPVGKTDDLAIILYSGGTTGIPKGIMLSNKNMIAEGMQVSYWGRLNSSDSILAILPIFHGFGLGVCVNAAFMAGCKSILVPTFTPETVAGLVKKKRPTFLIGVPTLFEALASNPKFAQSDLSCLKATFSGADTLPRSTKEKFEQVVKNGGGNVKLLEGYGLTEAVTAIMAMPLNEYREGSIGVPFPDMSAKIVKMGTIDEVAVGEEGEICLNGPAVMLGYLNAPDETAKTLQKHADGKIWLHTGDVGYMDKDGFFYFKLRQKRMLKVSGVNVYPTHVEEVLRKHPDIEAVCIIGVPDKSQISRVKAFVVLKDKSKATEETKKSIMDYSMSQLLKWESPREIEFRDELPKTLVGKIAFNELEKQELAKLEAAGLYPFDGSK